MEEEQVTKKQVGEASEVFAYGSLRSLADVAREFLIIRLIRLGA